jgi:UPF0716 protein FxsA
MYNALSIFSLLPLLEIIGFVMIGGKIGLGWSMLWLLADTMIGIRLLKAVGTRPWLRPRPEENDDFFQIEDAFDSLCLMIAGLLLVFPGFISDFIAVPFLFPPIRRWLFGRAKANPDSFMRSFTQNTQGFRTWTYRASTGGGRSAPRQDTIEAEYTRIDGDGALPREDHPRDARDDADENWPPRP